MENTHENQNILVRRDLPKVRKLEERVERFREFWLEANEEKKVFYAFSDEKIIPEYPATMVDSLERHIQKMKSECDAMKELMDPLYKKIELEVRCEERRERWRKSEEFWEGLKKG